MKRRDFMKGLMSAVAIPFVPKKSFFVNQQQEINQMELPVKKYRIVVEETLGLFTQENHPFVNKTYDSVKEAEIDIINHVKNKKDAWPDDVLMTLTPVSYTIKQVFRRDSQVPVTIVIVNYTMKCHGHISRQVQIFRVIPIKNIHHP